MKNKILILLIFINQFAFAQLELVNRVGHNTPAFVKAYNDTLFVCNDALIIYDVSGTEPEQIGQVDFASGYLQEIQYNNKKIYGAFNENGIIIYDASDISDIVAVDTIYKAFNFFELHLLNNNLIAIGKKNNIFYLTLINLSSKEMIDNLVLTNGNLEIKNMLVDSNYVYLTYGPRNSIDSSELHIVKHNSFQMLENISSLNIGLSDYSGGRHNSPILAIAKSNNFLYITSMYITSMYREPDCDIKIVDITNIIEPQIVKCWGNGTIKAIDIAMEDQMIYLTNTRSQLFLIQIEQDTTLNILARIRAPMPDYYNHDFLLNITNNKAYLNNWDNYAVFAFSISNDTLPEFIYSIEYGHDWRDVCISADGEKLYAAVWNCFQLYTIDVSDPQSAYIENRKELFGSGWGIESSGNFIYSAMGDTTVTTMPTGGMVISQITDSIPEVISWLPPRQGNHDVQINIDEQKEIAYIISGQPTAYSEEWENHYSHNPGLRVVSIEQLTDTLQEINFIPMPYQCRAIHGANDKIYIVATDTVLEDSSSSEHCGLFQINKNTDSIEQEWHPRSNKKMYAVYATNDYVYCGFGNSLLCFNSESLLLIDSCYQKLKVHNFW